MSQEQSGGNSSPNNLNASQGEDNIPDGYIPEEEAQKKIEELQEEMTQQGEKLGKYQEIFQDVQPLLNKLDGQPELVDAILNGDIDADIAQKVADGEITPEQAQAEQDHKDANQSNEGDNTQELSIDKLEQMVEEKTGAVKEEVEKKLQEQKRKRQFEKEIEQFMESTPDFDKYADDIAAFLNEHEEIENIEVAYNAVKGQRLEQEQKEQSEQDKKQEAKRRAMNAAGGRSQGGQPIQDSDALDDLIAPSSNPNSL